MKKNNIIIVSALIAIVLLASVIAPRVPGNETNNNTGSTAESGSTAENGSEENTENNTGSIAESTTEDQAVESMETTSSETESSGSGQNGSGSSSQNKNSETQQQTPEEQTSGESHANIPTISFPYTIAGADLVIEQISAYNGYFIEDGSDKAVKGVAAIVVTNKGSDLEFAGIGIAQGSRSLAFSASQIPAGATVIIQEQNGAAYASGPYYSATATTKRTDHFKKSEDLVSVQDNGDNTLSVINLTDKKLPKVVVHFKNYMPDEDVYVGGITYTISLADVEPGVSTEVSANHYDSKFSVVVEVNAEQ